MSHTKIKKGFNFLSHYYDFLLLAGSANLIIKSQTKLISFLIAPKKVLLMGDGTGNFLKNLLLKHTPEKIVYIDISEGMIAQAKRKIKKINYTADIEYRLGSFEVIREEEKFDLIVTNYFLDLFPEAELEKHLSMLYNHLQQKGIFYVTDFEAVTGSRRIIFYPLLKFLYFFFRAICGIKSKSLPPIFTSIGDTSMQEIKSKRFFFGLLRTSLYKKS